MFDAEKQANRVRKAPRSLHHPHHVAHRLTIHSLETRSPRTPDKSAIVSAFRSISTQQTPGVHYIRLPDNRKGRKAAKEATDYWKAQWKILNQQDPPRLEENLYFIIDANPSTKSTILCPNSIVFAKNNELGQGCGASPTQYPGRKDPESSDGQSTEEPVTGRWRLKWVSQSKLEKIKHLERQAFSEAMQAAEASAKPDSYTASQLMRSVFDRLTAVAGLDDITWEFQFIEAPDVINATVSATGQVIVFSGLLKAIDNTRAEDEIAAVIGHEIAHVAAGHSKEYYGVHSLMSWILAPILPLVWGTCILPELLVITLPFGVVAGLVCMSLSRHRKKKQIISDAARIKQTSEWIRRGLSLILVEDLMDNVKALWQKKRKWGGSKRRQRNGEFLADG
ncbi:hypothetical protein G7Y79_00007g022900 [Physcia stellaris]|nr:hypothetical protein G7Y79_00007g022900 [Physcia stellaris]